MAWRPYDRIVTVAASEGSVVSLADLKVHLRVDTGDTLQDAHITASERAAVAAIERATQRLLIARQVTLRLPCLPGGRTPVELPGGRVASVTSVTAAGNAIEGSEVIGESPAVLVPAADWPVVDPVGYLVEIVYTAGMATVPPDLIAAIKLWVGHFFEHREAVGDGALQEMPLSVRSLIAPHRIPSA